MRLRSIDWLLLLVAIVSVAAGFYLNGPLCEITFCPNGTPDNPCPCLFLFPWQIAGGVTVAIVAVLIVAVRLRRGSS
jgi:hypothetical protein